MGREVGRVGHEMARGPDDEARRLLISRLPELPEAATLVGPATTGAVHSTCCSRSSLGPSSPADRRRSLSPPPLFLLSLAHSHARARAPTTSLALPVRTISRHPRSPQTTEEPWPAAERETDRPNTTAPLQPTRMERRAPRVVRSPAASSARTLFGSSGHFSLRV
jgi:hypothetical protein